MKLIEYDPKRDLIRHCLANPNLAEAYKALTGREAPEGWRKPDWENVDVAALTTRISEDFLEAFEAEGIRLNEPYDVFYQGARDGYFESYRFCQEIVCGLVRSAVEQRLRRTTRQREASGSAEKG